jgi:mycothiol synthase
VSLRERPFADADLPRVQAAVARWAAQAGPCGYCHPGDLAQRIYAGLRGAHPVGELVRLWERGDALAGVAICLRFGAAFDLFVAPELRGSADEAAMLGAAHAITARLVAARGGDAVESDVFRCDEARRRLLAQLGYAQYRVWDWIAERDLGGPLPAPQLPAGYAIRAATMDDAAQLAAARNEAFGDSWSAAQLRDEVMRKPGYACERELLVVDPAGAVAAFTIIWPDALNGVGLFEPVGTRPAFQRRGLARALMLAGLHELRRLGMRVARVEHDAANLPAGALYHGLGFTTRFETLGFRRGL